jgi:uncharacterized protein with HEPN domain
LAADEERVRRRLSDLAGFIAEARHLVGVGREAYLADSMSGAMLRNAGHYLLIKVATVVEKLPQSFKDGHPDVDWVGITRLRNLVAHHHDKIIDQTVWVAIESRLPELADKLDLR